MMCMDILSRMQQEMHTVLEDNILSFWVDKMQDSVHGGFYGRITGTDKLEPQAAKGAVLNARILWTFSSAYRLLKKPEYLEMATRAKRAIIDRFYDEELGGIYWSLDYTSRPLDTKSRFMLWVLPFTA